MNPLAGLTMLERLFFLGSLEPLDECQKDPYCSEAANNAQWGMLRGLMQHGVKEVRAVCPRVYPSFPRSRTLWVRAVSRRGDPVLTIDSPGFVNFGPLRVLTQVISVILRLLSLGSRYGRPQAILTYNLNPGYVLAGHLVARLWRIPLIPVAADLNPPDADLRGLRRIDARLQAALLRRARAVITFSSRTQRDFGLQQPVLKVEPGVIPADFGDPVASAQLSEGPTVLMFSGTLIEASGILWLLEAFRSIPNPNLALWITGRGDLSPHVERAAQDDSRIRYLGFVNREQLLELYGQADILVNPRPVWLPEHRYNFPSKLIQYMATGRPVITTATGDVGEYEPLVFLVERPDAQGLAQAIADVCSSPQEMRDARGRLAREYVLSHKTWEVETARMYDFLSALTHAN